MNIAVCVNTLSAGGAESFAAAISKEYCRLGHRVILLVHAILDEKGLSLKTNVENAGVSVINVNITTNIKKTALPIIYSRIFRKYGIELVHSNLEQTDTYVLLSRLFYNKLLIIRTLHNKMPFSRYPVILHRLLFRLFDMNFGCGLDMKDDYSISDLRKYIYPINNGIDTVSYSSLEKTNTRNKIREQLGLKDSDILCIQIGTMSPRFGGILTKAHDVTLRALSLLPNNIYVIFVGDCEKKDDPTIYDSNLVSDKRIIFKGVVANVSDYIVSSDIALAPSRVEGLPITGMEYATLGIPVIYSSLKQFDTLRNNSTMTFELDDVEDFASKWLDMIRNISTYKIKAEAGILQNSIKFSMKECAAKYIEQIESLILSKKHRV